MLENLVQKEIKVSVVCPVISRASAIGLLNAMYRNTEEKDWELIIITDDYPAPKDYCFSLKNNKFVFSMLREIFRDKENVKFLKASDSRYKFDASDKTFRVAAATNWGAANALGKYLFISNDDWYYTPFWLENYLAIANKVDMSRSVIVSTNIESWKICEQNADLKEKIWNTLIEAGRRYFFAPRDINDGVDESELVEYWKQTKIENYDIEENCYGPLGSDIPIFILRSIWNYMGGRKLNGCGNATTDFHDRLRSMGFTKIIPRNIYTYNILGEAIPVNYDWNIKRFSNDKNIRDL